MGDFKTAFVEGFGKSLAYGVGGILFLLMIGVLAAMGLLGTHRAGLWGQKAKVPSSSGSSS
jgi:hypothetical protein